MDEHPSADTLEFGADGAHLWYETISVGPDVVMLHPTPVHHDFWVPVARRLTGSCRVVLPDLRGHGRSSPGASGPTTVERLAGDMIRLLDELGIERAMFAGCSIGGYTLFELWRRT